MKKINISFIMYGGLTYGGAHKQAIILAQKLDKNKFNVNYFWCQHNKDKYSSFCFPRINLSLIDDLKKYGVNVIKFNVGYRDISLPNHPWFDTNFFEIFNKIKTDIVFSVRAGHKEFPFNHINKPIVEWNVFGGVDFSNNLVKSIAVSEWVQKEFIKNGGIKKLSDYCYVGFELKIEKDNLRHKLGISNDTLVFGFHQRNDDNIFAKYVLKGYKNTMGDINHKTMLIILGGSNKYKQLAKELKINVIFLPVKMDFSYVSKFLNTIDIFTHSAGAGETLGIAIIEAMFHKKPILSMEGINNGHIDVIGEGGLIVKNQNEFNKNLIMLSNNKKYRNELGNKGFYIANKKFNIDNMAEKIENIFIYISKKYKNKNFYIDNINQYKKFNYIFIGLINKLLLKYDGITSKMNILLGNFPIIRKFIKKLLKFN